ncbi:MAG: ATP-binding protein [Kofleriaceae bacterium]
MNVVEIDRALRKLRLSGMADVLEIRIQGAAAERQPHLDFLSALVGDELLRRQDRLLARRIKQAAFRDNGKTLDGFDLDFNKKMNRQLVYELATARFVERREDVLFLGPPGAGKSHLAQAIGLCAIQQGHRVCYREAHVLVEELADATLERRRKEVMTELATVPLLVIDDLGVASCRRRGSCPADADLGLRRGSAAARRAVAATQAGSDDGRAQREP